MSNYYEILNVPTTASTAEIQTAYEQQYDQWRRLVTHQDPNVVNQANQALKALETIRLDFEKIYQTHAEICRFASLAKMRYARAQTILRSPHAKRARATPPLLCTNQKSRCVISGFVVVWGHAYL